MLRRLLRPFRRRPKTAPAAQARSAAPPAAIPEPTEFDIPFEIRPLERDDLPQIPEIFRDSIRQLAQRDYEQAELDIWASATDDEVKFLEALQDGTTIVAVMHGCPIGFAQLHPADTIRMVYVHPECAHQGIATLLGQYLEDEARIAGTALLKTRASRTARTFFEKMGFRVTQTETVKRSGVSVERFCMEKSLAQ